MKLIITANFEIILPIILKELFLFFLIKIAYLRLSTKLAIVGTAVYVTVNNSIWGGNEYAKVAISNIKTSLPETTELIKEVCFLFNLYLLFF